ncbi:MAG: hypothetical protein JSW25_02275 [Thermoplasmata archaeon]|nr:MAG: hypothetical protein JSW25_02275 [Thermoplasmata archaeon]
MQDTLDAFEPEQEADPQPEPRWERDPSQSQPPYELSYHETHQESIDAFSSPQVDGPGDNGKRARPSRALQGLALEMEMERVALSEAAMGISRDELVITVAREASVPLERLDLVDGYLTDLELEGRIRRVGDRVVLHHPEDDDLLAMDLSEREFLSRYRRRHLAAGGGGAA